MVFNITWNAYAEPNVTGFYDIMTYANTTTENVFGMAMMMSLYIVFFIIFRKYGDDKAFLSSSFIMLVLSGILRGTSQIGDIVFMLFTLLTVTGIVIMYRSNQQ